MARVFPTTSDFINEATIGTINLGPGAVATIHAWIKTTQNGVIVNRWGGSSPGQQFLVWATGGNLQVACSDGAADVATGSVTITDGVWHSVALRRTAGNQLEAWVDGAIDGAIASTHGFQSVGNVSGSRYVIGLRGTVANSFGGAIAEVSVWKTDLTDGEMVALAKGASPLMVRPGDLYHYHPVWGGSPEIDLVPAKINLNVSGSPTVANHAPVTPPFPLAA